MSRVQTARVLLLSLGASGLLAGLALAGDWIHWRGPEQTGHAKEPAVPETFDITTAGKGNLIWKTDVGGRSAPLLMGDRLYSINAFDPGLPTEGERVTCFDANTGKVLWHYKVNVYHAEVVTSRLGWTTLTADPEAGRIYAHTTAGALLCLDKDGKLVWERHLTEEFGRFTGYGGRIVSPIYDSGLVMCGMINSSWGDMARGANRFIAFDAKTGEVVWITEPTPGVNFGTYQSTPVIAVINGQRLMIAGGAGGVVFAVKVRTGEVMWTYSFAAGAVNPSPVVDGNYVYAAHGEENPEGGPIGRVICLDASKIDPKTKKPTLVWEFCKGNRFGLAHPALADGKLYVPDDGSELFCFDAKKGPGGPKKDKPLWKYKYGTVARGAPLVNGNRLYIFDVNAKLAVLKLNGNSEPDDTETEEYNFRLPEGATGFCETHSTPIAANGRLYFNTQFDTYCIGGPNSKVTEPKYKPLPPETPYDENAAPVGIRIFPFEKHVKPGETVELTVKYLDANGREVKAPANPDVKWDFPMPPKTPTGLQPPKLAAELKPSGSTTSLTIPKLPPSQQGYVSATVNGLAGRARIRVVPQIPYKQDFEKIPEGAPPSGWVNTTGKYFVKKLPDGSKVLSKVNTDGRIPIARANGYITAPTATDYTIAADLMSTEVDGKLPDMGVVANRYTFVVDGKKDPDFGTRTVRLVSWEARPRVNKVVSFDWKPSTWYSVKLRVDQKEKTAVVHGKIWERGKPEPEAWTVEYEDPSPNREGAAAVYGYISNIRVVDEKEGDNPTAPKGGKATVGSEIYYDNVTITPNSK